MALRGAVTINLCGVTQHLDAGFNRTGITLADTGLRIHVHIFAAGRVQLAELFGRKRRLPRDRFLECFVTGLSGNLEIRQERDAVGDRDNRLGLAFSDARYLVGDRVERSARCV